MTMTMLTRTLDEELVALLCGEVAECLVCGEEVEAAGGGERVECPTCGSVLERPPPEEIPGQLTLMGG
jgi:tRNA(Ile2) C34 agmatinyltransferase TiaS